MSASGMASTSPSTASADPLLTPFMSTSIHSVPEVTTLQVSPNRRSKSCRTSSFFSGRTWKATLTRGSGMSSGFSTVSTSLPTTFVRWS